MLFLSFFSRWFWVRWFWGWFWSFCWIQMILKMMPSAPPPNKKQPQILRMQHNLTNKRKKNVESIHHFMAMLEYMEKMYMVWIYSYFYSITLIKTHPSFPKLTWPPGKWWHEWVDTFSIEKIWRYFQQSAYGSLAGRKAQTLCQPHLPSPFLLTIFQVPPQATNQWFSQSCWSFRGQGPAIPENLCCFLSEMKHFLVEENESLGQNP